MQKLLALISIILYFIAPKGYSYDFCLTSFGIYLISSIMMIRKNCRNTFINFEFFFVIVFFFSNYVYSIVYYPISPYFSLFNLPFNEDYLNKGTALSTIAVVFFNWGVESKRIVNLRKITFAEEKFKTPSFPLYVLSALFIPYMISLLALHKYTTEFESSLVNAILIYLIFVALFIKFYYARNTLSTRLLIKKTIDPQIILIMVYVLLFLLIGSRTIPLRIGLLSLFLYSIYIRQLSRVKTISIMLLGIFLMAFIGMTREGGDADFGGFSSVFDIGKDITINNRSLYVLMDYADKHGYTWGRTMLMNILSIVPFLQSTFLYITGWDLNMIGSGNLVTDLFYDENPAVERIGLGTNVVGDIYLAFGFGGVMVFMYMLGYMLKKVYNKVIQGNNLYILIYGLLFMDVVYFPRSSYFVFPRNIAWCLAIFYICKKKTHNTVDSNNSEIINNKRNSIS